MAEGSPPVHNLKPAKEFGCSTSVRIPESCSFSVSTAGFCTCGRSLPCWVQEASGPRTLAAFAARILNTHPALLPKFGGQGMFGDRVFEAVLAGGESESGASVRCRVRHRCRCPSGAHPGRLRCANQPVPKIVPNGQPRNLSCVFNNLQHRVILTIELSNDEFCSPAAIAWRQLFSRLEIHHPDVAAIVPEQEKDLIGCHDGRGGADHGGHDHL